jgi:hypothetical protein
VNNVPVVLTGIPYGKCRIKVVGMATSRSIWNMSNIETGNDQSQGDPN